MNYSHSVCLLFLRYLRSGFSYCLNYLDCFRRWLFWKGFEGRSGLEQLVSLLLYSFVSNFSQRVETLICLISTFSIYSKLMTIMMIFGLSQFSFFHDECSCFKFNSLYLPFPYISDIIRLFCIFLAISR